MSWYSTSYTKYKTNWFRTLPGNFKTLVQIFHSWFNFHTYNPATESDVQGELLWQSKFVTAENKTLCWLSSIHAGIFVYEFLHVEHPRFKSHEDISREFNVSCTFLQVLQLRSSLPLTWRSLLISPTKNSWYNWAWAQLGLEHNP